MRSARVPRLRTASMPQRADRQRDAVVRLAAGDPDQLEAATAEIADDAVGIGDAGDHPERRAARLRLDR